MAYGEYAHSGRSFGKCLYQLSKMGIPLRIVESVIFADIGILTYGEKHFASITWSDDTPIFLFGSDFSEYNALQQRFKEMQEKLMPLTADRARAITEENLASVLIEPYIQILDSAITTSAERGSSCIDVFKTLDMGNMDYPKPSVLERLKAHYQHLGFRWVKYADPDPGNPAYTKIEW